MADFTEIDLAALPRIMEKQIDESHLDEMGHMNMAWYAHLFSEAALGGLFGILGITLKELMEHRIGGVLLETHVHYLAEVRVNETVSIYCRFLNRSDKRFHLMLFMRNDNQDVLASSFETVGATIDLGARRMTPIPDLISSRIDSLIAEHQNLDWQPPICGAMAP